jgi:hypothetical protein
MGGSNVFTSQQNLIGRARGTFGFNPERTPGAGTERQILTTSATSPLTAFPLALNGHLGEPENRVSAALQRAQNKRAGHTDRLLSFGSGI